MNEEKKYPIADTFLAPQGEGAFAGTLMYFIRFAGCNVGKPIPDSNDSFKFDGKEKVTSHYGVIPVWQEECTTFDGRKFLCDTDFRVKERLTVGEILARVPEGVHHICLTGGEPLIHPIEEIISRWEDKTLNFSDDYVVHIETSGTKFPEFSRGHTRLWITVSPKANYLPVMINRANEIKFLVDENFPEVMAENISEYGNCGTIIWLSPINDIDNWNNKNLAKCLEIQSRHKTWRITGQYHKLWRTK